MPSPIHTSPPTLRSPKREYYLDVMYPNSYSDARGAAQAIIDDDDVHTPYVVLEQLVMCQESYVKTTFVKDYDAPRFAAIDTLYEYYKVGPCMSLHPDHPEAPPSRVRRLLYFYAFGKGPNYMLDVLGKTVFPPRAERAIRRYALKYVYRPKANKPAPFAASAINF